MAAPEHRPGAPDCTAATADTVLRLAMRVGNALLPVGMSANDVVALMLRLVRAYGFGRVHIDVTYTSISLSCHPGPGAVPMTYLQTVGRGVVDYTMVRALNRLVDDVEAGLSVDRAVKVCARIVARPHRYPNWARTLATAGVGAAASLLFTTSWMTLLITFAVGCLVDRMLAVFVRRRVPQFFQHAAAAALITAVAAAATVAGARGVALFAGLDATLVVVGGIVMLVAGMVIVGAVQDAIDQFYVTASARIFEVVMRTAGIIVGIVGALRLAQVVGAPLSISVQPIALGDLPAQLVAATLVAALFTLRASGDVVTIALAAAMGLVGWFAHALLDLAGAGQVVSHTGGALVAGFLATLLVARVHIPAFGLVSAALLPLMPGVLFYNGLFQVVGTVPDDADLVGGLSTLVIALEVALGVAAGVSLGTFLARPIAHRVLGAAARR